MVTQQVHVDGAVRRHAEPEAGGHDSVLRTAQQRSPQLAFILEVAGASPEAHPRGASHHQLEAAGVGHQGLAAVDRPHFGRRCAGDRQLPRLDLAYELQITARGVDETRRTAAG
ncbi:MAG: hypothetical protein ACRD0Q_00495 [Acidimicrobiales bacterium]